MAAPAFWDDGGDQNLTRERSELQARLDLDALSSFRTGLQSRAMAPASVPRHGFASTVVTKCATLMNGPG